MLNYKNKTLRIGLHILFWLSYLMIFAILTKLNNPEFEFMTIVSRTFKLSLPIDIASTYFTIYVLMPRYLYTAKYIRFIGSFIASAIVFILLQQAIRYFYFIPEYHPAEAYKQSFWIFPYFLYIVSTYSVVVLAVAIKLGKRWLESKDRREKLEKQNLKSELSNLKHQIGPHFLFNTLNNIDSLIFNNPDKASQAVIKLSELMRYMLYDSQQKKVLLSKEIEYVKNLIALQSLRTQKKDFIQFELKGESNRKMVPPLIFVPFIENAIKHGGKVTVDSEIFIKMDIMEEEVHFNIINFIDENKQKEKSGGIGLQNVKRRLQLLFPDKETLTINRTNSYFKVDLKLPFIN